jgi:hypothetical protein
VTKTLTAITYNEERTGELRRVVVGHQYEGRKVLAMSTAGDCVSWVCEGGIMGTIPAGSIVQVRETGVPLLPPRPSAQRKQPAKPEAYDPHGPVRSITYSNGIESRTITVGCTVTDTTGRPRQVAAIIPGDPVNIVGLNDDVLFQVGAGSVSRWG